MFLRSYVYLFYFMFTGDVLVFFCFVFFPPAPDGGTLYMEPHLIFDESELSKRTADVVIAPVVAQNIGPFPLVCGG